MELPKIGDRVRVKDGDFKEVGTVTRLCGNGFLAVCQEDDTTLFYAGPETEWEKIPSNKKVEYNNRPKHYGDGEFDLIDVWCERYSKEELRGAFKSQMSKYVDRLGYKDDEVDELDKIIDYAPRYKKHLEGVKDE